MMIIKGVTYTHPNRELLFSDLDLSINRHDKIALTGNNGSGKSTLLKIMTGELQPSAGSVRTASQPYYVPQLFGQLNDHSIARVLRIENKLKALKEILDGNVTEDNLLVLDNDWAIEERCREAFASWGLDTLNPHQPFGGLSGGQKTKVFLAGIRIHQPEIVLLDEPSNHLDAGGRDMLYEYIRSTTNTLVVVSHDRTLLNLLPVVYELGKQTLTIYGGNYDFYAEQKRLEHEALNQDLRSKEKELRKAKETERKALERREKLDARGKKKQENAGLPKIMMNTFRNNAEKSTARMKDVHAEKTGTITDELKQLRNALPDIDKMKMDFSDPALHKGKTLVTAKDINTGYDNRLLWEQPLSFQVNSGERIAIKGKNASGKTTLIKLILGELQPHLGTISNADMSTVYIDQDYSLVDSDLTVYEQAQAFNSGALQEHEIRIRLNRFLFTSDDLDKSCRSLSGGEKMRLMLCCLTIGSQAPDMIILDEPTNNLDIQNIEILTAAINEYRGTLVVVSHDQYFLDQIGIGEVMMLG